VTSDTHSPEETRQLARTLAQRLQPGDVVLLHGDLGLGKTCFAQGIAGGLGWEGPVNSPTFSLIQEYNTRPPLIHMDLYRLRSGEEVWNLGLEEMFDTGAVLLVEWPERCPSVWPEDAWHITLAPLAGDECGRRITVLPPQEKAQ